MSNMANDVLRVIQLELLYMRTTSLAYYAINYPEMRLSSVVNGLPL